MSTTARAAIGVRKDLVVGVVGVLLHPSVGVVDLGNVAIGVVHEGSSPSPTNGALSLVIPMTKVICARFNIMIDTRK